MVDAAAGAAEGTEETHQRPRLQQRLLRIGVRSHVDDPDNRIFRMGMDDGIGGMTWSRT